MYLKKIALAGATLITLAAPAAAMAQPYWDHDRGDHDSYRYRDRDDWRAREWRDRDDWRYAPRCFIENRGYYNWYGQYVSHAVRVCR